MLAKQCNRDSSDFNLRNRLESRQSPTSSASALIQLGGLPTPCCAVSHHPRCPRLAASTHHRYAFSAEGLSTVQLISCDLVGVKRLRTSPVAWDLPPESVHRLVVRFISLSLVFTDICQSLCCYTPFQKTSFSLYTVN